MIGIGPSDFEEVAKALMEWPDKVSRDNVARMLLFAAQRERDRLELEAQFRALEKRMEKLEKELKK